jgi:hypothetical protein
VVHIQELRVRRDSEKYHHRRYDVLDLVNHQLIDVNHEGATDAKTLQKMALFVNVVSLWFTFVNVVSLWFLVVLRVVSFVV